MNVVRAYTEVVMDDGRKVGTCWLLHEHSNILLQGHLLTRHRCDLLPHQGLEGPPPLLLSSSGILINLAPHLSSPPPLTVPCASIEFLLFLLHVLSFAAPL